MAKRKLELVEKLDRLLKAYLAGTIDDDAFKVKTAELEADMDCVTAAIDAEGNLAPSRGKILLAVFGPSQKAAKIWRGSNTIVCCQILDSICLNRQAGNVT